MTHNAELYFCIHIFVYICDSGIKILTDISEKKIGDDSTVIYRDIYIRICICVCVCGDICEEECMCKLDEWDMCCRISVLMTKRSKYVVK